MVLKEIRVGLLGLGTVGQSVYELIEQKSELISQKTGCRVRVTEVGVKTLSKERHVNPKHLTTDILKIAQNPELDVVIELMGDSPLAFEALKAALMLGKPVVTANKALLAKHGLALFKLAQKHQTEILFEASVGGGIPILRTLREGITCNQITSLKGIINGTANFILSAMTQEKLTFEEALSLAQSKGYAESDPSFDIEGIDAAYKLVILVMLCHGKIMKVEEVFTKGIAYIRPIDILMAERFGYRVKLLGITKEDADGFEARVHPTLIPKNHTLAHVNGAQNAMSYVGDWVKEGMQLGLGAGGEPTASAVVSDLIEVCRRLAVGNKPYLSATGFSPDSLKESTPKNILDLKTSYYLRFSVFDKPKVLAQITHILGQNEIHVKHIYQEGHDNQPIVPLIIFTHVTKESQMRKALKEIDALDVVSETSKLIRIEE